jgi:hypothetical protein
VIQDMPYVDHRYEDGTPMTPAEWRPVVFGLGPGEAVVFPHPDILTSSALANIPTFLANTPTCVFVGVVRESHAPQPDDPDDLDGKWIVPGLGDLDAVPVETDCCYLRAVHSVEDLKRWWSQGLYITEQLRYGEVQPEDIVEASMFAGEGSPAYVWAQP